MVSGKSLSLRKGRMRVFGTRGLGTGIRNLERERWEISQSKSSAPQGSSINRTLMLDRGSRTASRS